MSGRWPYMMLEPPDTPARTRPFIAAKSGVGLAVGVRLRLVRPVLVGVDAEESVDLILG